MGKIKGTVVETSQSLYSVKIIVNGHELLGDEPESYGSQNLGPAPYDLLLASLGACTAMTVRWLAIKKGWPLEYVEVHLSHEKKEDRDVFTKHVTIHGPDLTEEHHEKLQSAAFKCPVHQTLIKGSTIDHIS